MLLYRYNQIYVYNINKNNIFFTLSFRMNEMYNYKLVPYNSLEHTRFQFTPASMYGGTCIV